MNGSVVLSSEEASRPENKDLADLVGRLTVVKAAVDAAAEKRGSSPISWADLLVLAARTAVRAEWLFIKVRGP